MQDTIGPVGGVSKMAEQSTLMATQYWLIELRRIVGSDAVYEVLHMLRLSIAGLLARVNQLVGRVIDLVVAVRFDLHIAIGAIEGNERARRMLGAGYTLVGDLFATFELP